MNEWNGMRRRVDEDGDGVFRHVGNAAGNYVADGGKTMRKVK